MDMLKYKSLVEEGDLVIVYLDIRHMYPLTVKRDEVFQSKYGALKHNDIIGSKFGSCVSCTKGWVYVLFPTPELWTITLPHRTQILYAADISLIIVQLDLKPGSIVCEAGTGSGSLSHALIRAIAPDGFLHTFEFHEKRAEVAQEEFKSHGLSHLVKVERRDVCSDGFGIKRVADAVFLDLPNPWEAVPHAATAIKESGGRICSFSPCIEQVQRTCLAMQVSGFRDIVTVECLQRTLEVKKITQTIISFDKYDRVKLTPEANQKEKVEEEVEESNQEKPMKDGETVTHWTALPPLQSAGHTGYLTYASFLNFSESQ
ncbi:tRNA (adenine(58)-N(1))-methyltransferase catalytic subunit TRMT61A-like [Uloborus diversus]|uniref:tRNA (adenine(58)-N(1))-methyltransferase catalytic subunit TRMT61A-like n=1 Tax=Uloborus diversus TaxID=327109 RepID=UPI00240A6240|nr:tRNA (adenine(58)-N(1))-methyltransferase catalytic subunit TRMT61A-like [Uloborus diversus]